jgi:hypothetical protein
MEDDSTGAAQLIALWVSELWHIAVFFGMSVAGPALTCRNVQLKSAFSASRRGANLG